MIIFEDVTKRYSEDEEPVLHHFNEKIEDGEFVVFTGRSGIGKTTIIRLLLKEIPMEGGRIFVDNEDIGMIRPSKIPYYRRRIGAIFQDSRLMEDRVVYDNLSITRLVSGYSVKETEKRIMHVLSFLGIDRLHKRFPKELSGGERQKVCLARAIMNHPTFLLADEPTGNLDPNASRELIRLLELIHRQGTTVIMATHDMELLKDEALTIRHIPLSDKGEDSDRPSSEPDPEN